MHFSIVIILSFVPYMLGILEPFAKGYDLAEFGHIGQYGLIGPFIKPHSGSITLALAMIMITTYIRKENRMGENLFYIALLTLGFYELVSTYVRTGLAIYIISLLYLYLNRINMKKIILIIATSSLLFGVGVYLYHTNDVIRMRIDDKNKYNSSAGSGSGRLVFWENAIENWLDDDDSVILIGLGYDYSREKMYKDTGMLIFAHNRFLQVLQQEGLIGFGLFLTYIFLVYRFILQHRNSKYYTATNAIFIGILIEMMLQGGFFFNIVLYLSAYLVVLKKDYEEKREPILLNKYQG
jgi:O-antigen ligase